MDGFALLNILQGAINLLTSKVAALVFVIAVIGIGYGCIKLGKIPKEKAISIVIGIGIVYSAAYIAGALGIGT